MSHDALISRVATLIGLPARQASAIKVEPCSTGGNNRLYIVSMEGRNWIVKQYFRHSADRRDRLGAEQAFLKYAAAARVSCVPRAIAHDAEHGFGLYEYIEGRQLQSSDVSQARVREAAMFFLSLNRAVEDRSAAGALPDASEACFSIEEHFATVDRRIALLLNIDPSTEIDREAREFVGELLTHWQGVKLRIACEMRDLGRQLGEQVVDRCISPSDFGFHNALLRPSGEVCFIDFEYAGWDDPAKLVADFFCHPAVPVDIAYFDDFAGMTMGFSPHSRILEARVRLLFPMFQVKWCCIILNDFVPVSKERRRFADPNFDEEARKRIQLKKARKMFAAIQA